MRQKKILVVDDTPANLDVVVEMISNRHEVRVALDGPSALEIAAQERPDLILLDVAMPGMDGFETCRRLKAQAQLAAIPVIFLTAKHDPEDIMQGFALGAVDYVLKPFNLGELEARIRTHLELQAAREKIEGQAHLLEDKNREFRELLHVLCHDLQNPLGNIQAFVSIAKRDPAFVPNALEVFQTCAAQGLAIIDLVRQMRALEEKPLPLSPINLTHSLADSLRILQSKLEAGNIRVENTLPEVLTVWAEEVSLINSVLNNLLTNAIKFSPAGQAIRIGTTTQGQQVQVTLQDGGIGIPPSLLADLFDVHKPTSREGLNGELGTGFGMPLVQKFMQAYGGAIQVISKDADTHPNDHGTTITLTFWLSTAPKPGK